MVWGGRINAICGLIALVGLAVFAAGFVGYMAFYANTMWLAYVGAGIVAISIAVRVGFAAVDMFYRAIFDKPFVYEQRIETRDGNAGQISE